MTAVLNRPGSAASRTYRVNSPATESARLLLRLPPGTQRDLARRLGRQDDWVYAQTEGKHPLTVDVLLGCLHAIPEDARQLVLAELLDGMVAMDHRIGLVEALRTIQDAVRAAEGLLEPEER